ncbi:MAG: PsbP-related protein [Patescibacteria group bacterium]
MPNKKKDISYIIVLGLILSLSILNLSATILNRQNADKLEAALAASQRQPTDQPIGETTPEDEVAYPPSIDSTAYANTKYGFTFRYPSDWQMVACGDEYIALSHLASELPACDGESWSRVNIKVFPKDSTTVAEYVTVYSAGIDNLQPATFNIDNIDASELTGVTQEQKLGPPAGLYTQRVIFGKDGDIYQLYYYGLAAIDKTEEYNIILNSFHFV